MCIQQIQDLWKQHVEEAYDCCCPNFWKLFKSIRKLKVTDRDTVLSTVKDLVQPAVSGRWPRTNRTLRNLISRKAGNFWDNVVYTHKIDLTSFKIPGCESVQFTFVDPIFVWIQRCVALHECGIPLQWDPKSLRHPLGGEELYGAGIEYGLLLRSATAAIPVPGKIALLNISWDGGTTGFGSRSAVPILVQVMNTNSMSIEAVSLLGYLPYIEVAGAFKQAKQFVKAKRFLLQVTVFVGGRVCVYTNSV